MPIVPNDRTIVSFVFEAANNEHLSADVIGTVDNDEATVAASVGGGVYVASLIPTVTLADTVNCSISPLSGVAQDFTDAVTYRVTDDVHSLYTDYTVTVTHDVVEAVAGQTHRSLDFKRWYVCTTCNHTFKDGDGAVLGGKPYCAKYGCVEEQISLRRRGK